MIRTPTRRLTDNERSLLLWIRTHMPELIVDLSDATATRAIEGERLQQTTLSVIEQAIHEFLLRSPLTQEIEQVRVPTLERFDRFSSKRVSEAILHGWHSINRCLDEYEIEGETEG
jgi:hypothetical protein